MILMVLCVRNQGTIAHATGEFSRRNCQHSMNTQLLAGNTETFICCLIHFSVEGVGLTFDVREKREADIDLSKKGIIFLDHESL